MTAGLIVVGIVVAGLVIYFLLTRITAWGGDRTDGLEVASKFMAEADAFRGSSDADASTWDGKNRIAPPTNDGGGA